jgi:hypothetical protein
MPQARYYVVPHGDVWLIKFDDEEYGPFRSRAEAMRFAIDAAQKLGECGENAQVCLRGDDRIRAEWDFSPGSFAARKIHAALDPIGYGKH